MYANCHYKKIDDEALSMSVNTIVPDQQKNYSNTALLLGAGLALASFIILPAVATRIGLGSSLTGAMRIALMKASNKASRGHASNSSAENHRR